jgi:probable F420-dependent oxidoreductase
MITGTGIWSAALRYGDAGEVADVVGELQSWGYTAVWVPDAGGDLFGALDRLLAASTTMVAAAGVLNVWHQTAEATNAWWSAGTPEDRARVLLGLGVSNVPLVGESWGKPMAKMTAFLDALEVPRDHLCLAAMGPKMLELAGRRTAGAHPYLVTPEHTAQAREVLGPGALLAPEQGVVFESDPDVARSIAREEVTPYAQLPNYIANWKHMGFTDDDIATVSDRLIDRLFAWGDVEAIAERVAEHRAAGADHVCLQVMPAHAGLHRDAWQELAGI